MTTLQYNLAILGIGMLIATVGDLLNAQPWAVFTVCAVYGLYLGILRGKGKI